jgi:hypothetical protein
MGRGKKAEVTGRGVVDECGRGREDGALKVETPIPGHATTLKIIFTLAN